jgi:hypothetical protein
VEQANTGLIVLRHPQSKVHGFVGSGATIHGNDDFFDRGLYTGLYLLVIAQRRQPLTQCRPAHIKER